MKISDIDFSPDLGTLQLFENLLELISLLRGPDGCPWDREQSIETLKQGLMEESKEVSAAISCGDKDNLCEELGDLLMQILMICQIAKEDEMFSIDHVFSGIGLKLIRRHPHIFVNKSSVTLEDVKKQWEEIKKLEKK